MPLLDVSDVFWGPDFADSTLVCVRQVQSMGLDGRAINTPQVLPFTGVVCAISGVDLTRNPEGEYNYGSISIVTLFPLVSGEVGLSADVIQWHGNSYTVKDIQDYTKYGAGFTQAQCDLIDVSG